MNRKNVSPPRQVELLRMSMAQLRAIVKFADPGELPDPELWFIHDLAVVAVKNGDVDAKEVLLEVDSLI